MSAPTQSDIKNTLTNFATTKPYGTLQWFEQAYDKVPVDPWGLTWRPSQQLRYHKVLSTLEVLQGPIAHVMDVGCATGDFTDLVSRYIPGLQTLLGVDFVESAVGRARRRFPQLTFSSESLLALGDKYPERFDLITCLEVIYYVPPAQQIDALRSLRRALRPGGHAILSSMISPPPYFFTTQFLDIVGREFEIVRAEVLHLRMVSLLEKLADRSAKLQPFHIGTYKCGRRSFRTAVVLESWSRKLRTLTASHTIVLAQAR